MATPFQIKLGPEASRREPDVLFVSKTNLERLTENRLEGPADLAVDIISPESRARDRGEKFYEHEQGGVTEYWLIEPTRSFPPPLGFNWSGVITNSVYEGSWFINSYDPDAPDQEIVPSGEGTFRLERLP